MSLSMLYKNSVPVNDAISIRIPTVGEVIDAEDDYYRYVSMLTAMPIDMMVQLDDAGTDFTKINEYELFISLFNLLKGEDLSIIFGNLDLSKFYVAVDNASGEVVLRDEDNDITIDRRVYECIANTIREINHIEKNTKKPANEEAKQFMIERARKKLKRLAREKQRSQIQDLIVAMVNTEQFKYDFDGIRELSIYQFNECVMQVVKKVNYDNIMHGVYAGTINQKDLSQDDLNWLSHK